MDLFTLLDKSHIHYDLNQVFNHVIHHIEDNSTILHPNDIFVAIKGETIDGHTFIEEAIQKHVKTILYEDSYYRYTPVHNVNMIKVRDTKKALAILLNQYHDDPSTKVNLVGVTGTNGKTSVATLIHQMHQLLGESSTFMGTTGIELNHQTIETQNTTPKVTVIQDILLQSIEQGIKNVIMEVSSHSLKQQRVSQLHFKTAIYTNFSHDHLDYHKTFDDYFYSKSLLFSSMGNHHNDQKVLLNGDDKYANRFIHLTQVEYFTYGITLENDFQARNILCDMGFIQFDFYAFNTLIGTVNTHTIFGFFNIYNLLAMLSYFYIEKQEMRRVLEQVCFLKGIHGRMEKVPNKANLNVFIDYAHTPDSVFRILNEVRMICRRHVICVIGCGGNRDALKRPIIGKIASNLADYVIFTSDNPRFEDPMQILDDLIKGASRNNYEVIENRSKAIKYAIQSTTEEDVLLILGKGHENYQIIENKKHYFSDFDEVLKFTENRKNVLDKETEHDL